MSAVQTSWKLALQNEKFLNRNPSVVSVWMDKNNLFQNIVQKMQIFRFVYYVLISYYDQLNSQHR